MSPRLLPANSHDGPTSKSPVIAALLALSGSMVFWQFRAYTLKSLMHPSSPPVATHPKKGPAVLISRMDLIKFLCGSENFCTRYFWRE